MEYTRWREPTRPKKTDESKAFIQRRVLEDNWRKGNLVGMSPQDVKAFLNGRSQTTPSDLETCLEELATMYPIEVDS